MTAPLVPPEVDLRDFAFMPLEIARLRQSRAWLIAKKNPELAFYMMNLWMAAWHQRPAGSLEDDDEVLLDLSMCKPARWNAVRDQALRGWVKGDDGRLYHPVVAEKVMESWKSKQAQRARTAAATAARHDQRNVQRNVQRNDNRNDNRNDGRDDNATESPRSPREVEVKGSGSGSEGISNREVVPTPTGDAPANHGQKGAIEKRNGSKTKHIEHWSADEAGINATAVTLGINRHPQEDDKAWKDRVVATVNAKRVSDDAKARRGGHA